MARSYDNISMGGYTFRTLRNPAPQRSRVSDVTWRKTPGGKEISTKFSDPRWRWSGQIWLICDGSPDDLSTWNTFVDGLSGLSTTFAFVDHRDESYTARFLADPGEVDDEAEDILIPIEVIQVRT